MRRLVTQTICGGAVAVLIANPVSAQANHAGTDDRIAQVEATDKSEPPTATILSTGLRLADHHWSRQSSSAQPRRRDPLSNGAWIGAGVGAGIGFVVGWRLSGCVYESECYAPLMFLGGGAAIGAGIGAGIDALHRARTAHDPSRRRVIIAPVVSKKRHGVVGSVAF